ncbi:hypothetical protein D3C72_1814030 [compost metagenome]
MFVVVGAQHAGHGAKNFFARNAVFWLGQKQRWAHVVAGRGALHPLAAPHVFSAFCACDLDVAQVLVQLARVHHGAHLDTALQRVSDLEGGQPLAQPGHEGIVHA